MSSTLNVWEMVTLTRLQQTGSIPWAQIIDNHFVIMRRTKVVTPAMPNNIYRIFQYVEVVIRMFWANFVP